MTTIPQRLRDIAQAIAAPYPEYGMPPSPYDIARLIKAIAAELEEPASDAVQVVAYGYENTRPTERAPLMMVKLSNAGDQYPELATKLVRQRDHIATVAALQEETESLRQQLADLAGRQQYKGNSVSFIYQKKDAYASAIDKVFDVLGKHGYKADGSTHVADLTDQALCALQARINELESRQEQVRAFLDIAAGEGMELGGVDAGDLYVRLFGHPILDESKENP